jgi:NADH:ubiquinone oxidoreductase subunit 6 (subunit J)
MLGVLSLLGITLIGNLNRAVYVLAMTLLFGFVATWLGTTALSRSRRGGSGRPRGAIAGVILGAIGLGLSGLMLIAFGVLGPQLSQYSKCLSGANTVTAQQACRTQFQNSVGGIIGGINK